MTMKYRLDDHQIRKIDFGEFLQEQIIPTAFEPPSEAVHHQFTTRLKSNIRLRRDSAHAKPLTSHGPKRSDFTSQRPNTTQYCPMIDQSHNFRVMRQSNVAFEDFLKGAIVGEHKMDGKKSEQIIKSLNGTWFRQINQTKERSSLKLQNTIGIKRGHSLRFKGESPEEPSFELKEVSWKSGCFPARKTSNARCFSPMKTRDSQPKIKQEQGLKNKILGQFGKRPDSVVKSRKSVIRRAVSSMGLRQSSILKPFSNQRLVLDEPFVKGTKMLLHL